VVSGAVQDRNLVAGAHRPRGQHPEIGARRGPLGKPLDPAAFGQEVGERAAGDPGVADLQYERVADFPPFADRGGADVDADSGQVLTEAAVGQRFA